MRVLSDVIFISFFFAMDDYSSFRLVLDSAIFEKNRNICLRVLSISMFGDQWKKLQLLSFIIKIVKKDEKDKIQRTIYQFIWECQKIKRVHERDSDEKKLLWIRYEKIDDDLDFLSFRYFSKFHHYFIHTWFIRYSPIAQTIHLLCNANRSVFSVCH